MNDLTVGDLVEPRYLDQVEDYDAIGLILEIRLMQGVQLRILWSDIPEPRWMNVDAVRPLTR